MDAKVGLIGAGAMGQAIGARLLERGVRLTVFDRNPPKVQALVEKGALGAADPAEVGAGACAVILSLNSADAVEEVVFGAKGVAAQAEGGTLVIDMSSIDPGATRTLAERAAAAGLRWVDSPLSGGAPKALDGALTLMVGGTEADVADARRVLDHLAANLTHMGPSGAGQATKLINQVLCGIGFLAVAEATALAENSGVDAALIPRALKGGRADSAILQEYMPRYVSRDYRKTGRLDNFIKDLNGAQDLSRQSNTALPLTAVTAEIHRLMTAAGFGGEDEAVLIEYFRGMDRSVLV